MNKTIIILLISILVSCKTTKKSENTQNEKPIQYENAVEEITWLGDLKKQFSLGMGMAKKQIIQYTYKNNTVFLINGCVKCPDNKTTVYDANHNVVCEFGGITGANTCPDFYNKAINKKMLFEN